MEKIKIVILYSRLSGYMASCLKKMKELYDVELMVFSWPISKNAPFSDKSFSFIDHHFQRNKFVKKEIHNKISGFNPQAILTSGWMDKDYVSICRGLKSSNILRVAGIDTQFSNSLRQKVASIISPLYLHTAFDVLWVAGERQRVFAKKLGYETDKCWDGIYSCDWEKFSKPVKKVINEIPESGRKFLFVGRYSREKGINTLINGYREYRSRVESPWELICAGKGPMKSQLDNISGVMNIGFVQPEDLPSLFHQSDAFLLPSYYEPWGVVIHEAATASLPIICTNECGASVALLRDGFNGFLMNAYDDQNLAERMERLHHMSDKERKKMGENSYLLSKQYTPERWAQTFVSGIQNWKKSIKIKY